MPHSPRLHITPPAQKGPSEGIPEDDSPRVSDPAALLRLTEYARAKNALTPEEQKNRWAVEGTPRYLINQSPSSLTP